MSHYLPLFPLETVVFEGEELRLHIFEPRYKQLIRECLEGDLCFGIPVVIDQKLEGSGTELRVEKLIQTFPGGEMDIVCRGLRRFVLEDFIEQPAGKPYAAGFVEFLPFVSDEDKELKLRIQDLLEELYRLSGAAREKLPENLDDMTQWIHKCGLTVLQESECARLQSLSDRQLYLIHHLKEMVRTLEGVNKMKELIRLNGHFKKFSQTL